MTYAVMYTHAPETFDESVNSTVRVDVYASGMILYAMFQEPKFFEDAPTKPLNATKMVQKKMRGEIFTQDPSIPPVYW